MYKTEPLFVLDCSHEELVAYLMRHYRVKVEPVAELAGQMLTFTCAPWRVVWVKDGSRKNLPVLLHELFHLITRICEDKGIPIKARLSTGENGDEPAAYLFEFFAQAMLKRIRK